MPETAGGASAARPSAWALPRLPQLGEIVRVTLDPDVQRPMIISAVQVLGTTPRVSGTIFCEPDDYSRPALRGAMDRAGDPGRIEGRPSRTTPIAYGHRLAPGSGIGQWEFAS